MINKTQIAVREAARCYRFEHPYVYPVDTADGRPMGQPYVPSTNSRGYPIISFRRRRLEICMKVQVHQVVAYQLFGESIFGPGVQCRHRDNNKLNFSPSNLVLGTALDNHHDNSPETRAYLTAVIVAEGRKQRKLTDEQVTDLRARADTGETYVSLASRFGVSKSTVYYIVNRQTYRTPLEA